MKLIKLSILENKYYYGISRWFWHLVIGIGILTIVLGIFFLLWSITPTSKEKITKGAPPTKRSYPKPVQVTYDELLASLPKEQKKLEEVKKRITITPKVSEYIPEETEVKSSVDSVGLVAFERQMGTLKTLIPEVRYEAFWNPVIEYIYPGGERDRKMYKKTHNEKLRERIVVYSGFRQKFINYTDAQGVEDFGDKADLLSAMNRVIENVPEVERAYFMRNDLLKSYRKGMSLSTIIKLFKKTSNSLSKVEQSQVVNTFTTIVSFFKRNPIDGLSILKFENSVLDSFAKPQRHNIIKIMNNEYRTHFNNQLSSFVDNTSQFIPVAKRFIGDQQIVALKNFYQLYNAKNGNRNVEIARIENDYAKAISNYENKYQERLVNAQKEFSRKKKKKKEFKSLSFKGIAIGFGIVLLITLILLVLSMIRNINRLAEAMIENNKITKNKENE